MTANTSARGRSGAGPSTRGAPRIAGANTLAPTTSSRRHAEPVTRAKPGRYLRRANRPTGEVPTRESPRRSHRPGSEPTCSPSAARIAGLRRPDSAPTPRIAEATPRDAAITGEAFTMARPAGDV